MSVAHRASRKNVRCLQVISSHKTEHCSVKSTWAEGLSKLILMSGNIEKVCQDCCQHISVKY